MKAGYKIRHHFAANGVEPIIGDMVQIRNYHGLNRVSFYYNYVGSMKRTVAGLRVTKLKSHAAGKTNPDQ